ncbi:DUF305 domain-containing protein [Dyadobacter tibetensis]|uniref:DUF305 domain-containing protein n=1 Tax=Dyadobacter tibetensis TaxID=1211851 RepID=UPI000470731D|nr:DUF305 domain-containing protein [Dyadobacter tibetensis]
MKLNAYKKFGLMLLISFVIMYAVMFLNVDQFSHIYLSYTRVYMTLLMIAPMAILMLLMMPQMYPDSVKNLVILSVSILVFVLALAGLRKQVFISDIQYMQAMIPHHSSAILTSEQANLKDPEVQQLAKDIIRAQKKEIAQMKQRIEDLSK